MTDAFNRSKSASRLVTVATGPTPTALFVFSPAAPTTTTRVQFNATTSTAPPGRTITSYVWNFGDGVTKTGVTTDNSFSVAGVYDVTLTVTDSVGATNTTSRTITVTAVALTASFTASPSPTTLGALTVVDAAASTPSNGATITSYTWNFGDTTGTFVCPGAGACNGAVFSHTYAAAGRYAITLSVTDSLGLTGTTTETLVVRAVSDPTADFTASPSSATAPVTVNFNGSASSASGGRTIATYTWDFGDGSSTGALVSATTTHLYTATGTFTVTLTVTDSAGATGTATTIVTISS